MTQVGFLLRCAVIFILLIACRANLSFAQRPPGSPPDRPAIRYMLGSSSRNSSGTTLYAFIQKSRSFVDTGIEAHALVGIDGTTFDTRSGVSASGDHFAVFYGDDHVVIVLPGARAIVESFDGSGLRVQGVEFSHFEEGDATVVRIYTLRGGETYEGARRLSRAIVLARGHVFEVGPGKVAQMNDVIFNPADRAGQTNRRDKALLQDLRADVSVSFSRRSPSVLPGMSLGAVAADDPVSGAERNGLVSTGEYRSNVIELSEFRHASLRGPITTVRLVTSRTGNVIPFLGPHGGACESIFALVP